MNIQRFFRFCIYKYKNTVYNYKKVIRRGIMQKIKKNERRQIPSERSLTVEKHTMTGKYPQHWHNTMK